MRIEILLSMNIKCLVRDLYQLKKKKAQPENYQLKFYWG